ncbi:MAG: hypothetical protein AAFQ92_18215 [Bacteroidota bacterium]
MMKNNCYFVCLLLYALWGGKGLIAQQGPIKFEEPQFPSPNAAALGEYGDFPVSYHTGVPNISIPIYTVTEGSLQVPISLSYHSSGIQVDEVASWVGLGWSLNAGGVITRMINGTPDEGGFLNELPYPRVAVESQSGWMNTYGLHPSMWECGSRPQSVSDYKRGYVADNHYNSFDQWNIRDIPTCVEWMFDANEGYIDTQPDIFNFNFNGYSGKFIFHKGKPMIIGESDVRIEPAADLSSWVITTTDGTKYYFGGRDATEHTHSYSAAYGIVPQNRRSTSYYLTKIESVNGTHFIEFSYESENFLTSGVTGHMRSVNCAGAQSMDKLLPTGNIKRGDLVSGSAYAGVSIHSQATVGKRLSRITTSSGKLEVQFIANHVRQDLLKVGTAGEANVEAKALDEIRISEGRAERSFMVNHGYFDCKVYGPGFGRADEQRKLKLISIRQKVANETLSPYIFEYDESELIPQKNSLGRDHWGYYNGNDHALGLIPENATCPCGDSSATLYAADTSYVNVQVGTTGVTRDPDSVKMQVGILKRIIFPTKGYTDFIYSPHMFEGKVVGGLRIRKIISNPNDGNPALEKNFVYEDAKLFAGYPNGNSYIYTSNSHFGYNPPTPHNEIPATDYIAMGNPRSAMRTAQGYHIGYGKVSVRTVGNGSHVYYYHNPDIQADGASGGYGNFPSIPAENDLLGGTLVKEEIRDETGMLLVKKELEYEIVDLGLVYGYVPFTYDAGFQVNGIAGAPDIPLTKPNYRKYTWKAGIVRLKEESAFQDGVETVRTIEYTSPKNHNAPISETVVNSDQSVMKTEYQYFSDAGVDFSSLPDISDNCLQIYYQQVGILRNEYQTQQIGKAQFTYSMDFYVNEYISCLGLEWTNYDAAKNAVINSVVGTDPAIAEMVRRNIIVPLEVRQLKDGALVGASKQKYILQNFPSGTHILPAEYYVADVSTPGNFSWRRTHQVSFDELDHIQEVEAENSQKVTYLWFTPATSISTQTLGLPLAKVINASNDQVAYTSFEAPKDGSVSGTDILEDGAWEIVRTAAAGWVSHDPTLIQSGINGFHLANKGAGNERYVRKRNLPAGKYKVSFWHKGDPVNVSATGQSPKYTSAHNGLEMQYQEFEVQIAAGGTVEVSCSQNAYIDELRLYPMGAQMTTYCYDEALRYHTVTDPNNRSAYYKYDAFGRLLYVQDQDRNYVQSYEYHYQN